VGVSTTPDLIQSFSLGQTGDAELEVTLTPAVPEVGPASTVVKVLQPEAVTILDADGTARELCPLIIYHPG
jgi:hypothetical protein